MAWDSAPPTREITAGYPAESAKRTVSPPAAPAPPAGEDAADDGVENTRGENSGFAHERLKSFASAHDPVRAKTRFRVPLTLFGNMKLNRAAIYLLLISFVLVACQTTPVRAPVADDEDLSNRVVGTWVRDESYAYGRFIGTLQLNADGTGIRLFDIVSVARSSTEAIEVDPLLVERFRWHIESGYVVFTERQIEDVDAHSREWGQIKDGQEHREFISALTQDSMSTIDPWKKTDRYRKFNAKRQPNQSPETRPTSRPVSA